MYIILYAFCKKYNIFKERQNDFRKNRYTTLAVYKFIQETPNTLNNKKYAIEILLDMSKAYDKVKFDILINKLFGIGIRRKAINWLKLYLKDWEQLVEIEYFNHSSNKIEKMQKRLTHQFLKAALKDTYYFYYI